MTKIANSVPQDDDAVERLLAQAEPRPAPSPDVAAAARAAVKREWQQTVQRRNRWRYAVAASTLIAALVFVSTSWVPPAQPIPLAAIDRVNGTFNFMRDDGFIEDGDGRNNIVSGETIMTGNNASVGLRWLGGGSLRLDAATTIRVVASDQIELLRGRVYYDSGLTGSVPGSLLVHTDQGDLQHLGTQYMADVRESDLLRVSVREGAVAIAGLYHDAEVQQGKQLVMHGDRLPVVANLEPYSAEWRWTQSVAPAMDTNGKTFYEILQWVSRETGLSFRFASDAAETLAGKPLTGVEGDEPMATLRVGAAAAQLTVEQIDGVMLIHERSP
tara:strand:- start:14319 stop:15305 length:987 start_codon:yes stop_codon:yes gene_type:complete